MNKQSLFHMMTCLMCVLQLMKDALDIWKQILTKLQRPRWKTVQMVNTYVGGSKLPMQS